MSNDQWNQWQQPQSGSSAPANWENSNWQAQPSAHSAASATPPPAPEPTSVGYPAAQPAQQFGAPTGGYQSQQQFAGAAPQQQWGGQQSAPSGGIGSLFDLSFTRPATPSIAKLVFLASILAAVAIYALGIILAFQWGNVYGVSHSVIKRASQGEADYTLGILTIVLGWIPPAFMVMLTRVFLEAADAQIKLANKA